MVWQVEVCKRALAAANKPFPAEFPGRRECVVARTCMEAIGLRRPYLAKRFEIYHAWGQDKAMAELPLAGHATDHGAGHAAVAGRRGFPVGAPRCERNSDGASR